MFKPWSARKTNLCMDYYDGKKIAAMNAIHITWTYWHVSLEFSRYTYLIFRKSENRNFVTQIHNAESITENRNDYAKIVIVGRYDNALPSPIHYQS